jgi:hypothetical protein
LKSDEEQEGQLKVERVQADTIILFIVEEAFLIGPWAVTEG